MFFKIIKPLIISVTLAAVVLSVNACSELRSIIEEPQEIGSVETSTSQTDTATESSDAENLILFDDWKTNWLEKSIDLTELTTTGSARDGIMPLDDPVSEPVATANTWIMDKEPIITLVMGDIAKAYPLKIMIRHEVVNDMIKGTPVAVTFCPLTSSTAVFNREVNEQTLDFGTSGLVRNSNFLMWDRQTETLWQQLTGRAIVGDLSGAQLNRIPALVTSWKDFKESYPDGIVLSNNNSPSTDYNQTPYIAYDDKNSFPFLFHGSLDDRFPAMERIVGIQSDGESIAFPFSILSKVGVINYTFAGKDITVLFSPSTISVLDSKNIGESKDVGTAAVFYRTVDEKTLNFKGSKEDIIDAETGSTWSMTGVATSGPLQGAQLQTVEHSIYFWFAWAAFYPETLIYEVPEEK
ncbi:MAG: DUF3179 domain-containing protein [Actinobacteria bacterium]|nr:DUF3179 domain-containing protein [Actinomycetota bacterium]